MKIRKPYTPTMSRRKLKGLTKITKNNLGKVMGQLNNFFSQPTLHLNGYASKVIGQKVEEWNGRKITFDIYSKEQYPNYVPYEAKCSLHRIWIKYLKGYEIPFFKGVEEDIPCLAISMKYINGCCIPIHFGDSYKIYGNRLIIMHKWDKLIYNTPWLRYNEFIQVKSYGEEQVRRVRIGSCVGNITESLCELTGVYGFKYSSFVENYIDKISYELENILEYNYNCEKIQTEINGLSGHFTMIVYPKKALDPNNTENFIEFINDKGEKYKSCIKYIMNLIEKKQQENYEKKYLSEDEFIPDYDLDWDSFD